MNRAVLLVPFLMLSPCALNAADDPPAPATLGELQDAVAAVIREREVPAVGIAMVDADGPIWVGALGKADLEKGVPADENTMFRIGSTSKMFVALAVLKLVEEGRLSLDDRVADLAPDVAFENPWEDTDPVRVVHPLEHTTGWDDIHLPEYAHNDPTPATLKQGLDFHPHSRVSRWLPGTRISYCNSGPAVAAYIVQQITGEDFEDYVRQNFFAPMGMQSATFRLTPEVEARGATLYANGNEPQAYRAHRHTAFRCHQRLPARHGRARLLLRESGRCRRTSADFEGVVGTHGDAADDQRGAGRPADRLWPEQLFLRPRAMGLPRAPWRGDRWPDRTGLSARGPGGVTPS